MITNAIHAEFTLGGVLGVLMMGAAAVLFWADKAPPMITIDTDRFECVATVNEGDTVYNQINGKLVATRSDRTECVNWVRKY